MWSSKRTSWELLKSRSVELWLLRRNRMFLINVWVDDLLLFNATFKKMIHEVSSTLREISIYEKCSNDLIVIIMEINTPSMKWSEKCSKSSSDSFRLIMGRRKAIHHSNLYYLAAIWLEFDFSIVLTSCFNEALRDEITRKCFIKTTGENNDLIS